STVDIHEGSTGPRARSVDHASDQALAGTGLSSNQDRREAATWFSARGETANLLSHRLNSRAFADQVGQRIHDSSTLGSRHVRSSPCRSQYASKLTAPVHSRRGS